MTEGIERFIKELKRLDIKWYLPKHGQIRTRPIYGACPICAVAGADSIFWRSYFRGLGLDEPEAIAIISAADKSEMLNYFYNPVLRAALLEACNLKEENASN